MERKRKREMGTQRKKEGKRAWERGKAGQKNRPKTDVHPQMTG